MGSLLRSGAGQQAFTRASIAAVRVKFE